MCMLLMMSENLCVASAYSLLPRGVGARSSHATVPLEARAPVG